jgi:hypothetical protein
MARIQWIFTNQNRGAIGYRVPSLSRRRQKDLQQRLKPKMKEHLYAGLKACSTLRYQELPQGTRRAQRKNLTTDGTDTMDFHEPEQKVCSDRAKEYRVKE